VRAKFGGGDRPRQIYQAIAESGREAGIEFQFSRIRRTPNTVLSHRLVGAMGLAERWPRCIALWNWCNVIQYMLLVVFSIPGLLGAPALLDQVAQLVGLGWALWLEWFAFRLTLGIAALPAVGLVALDVAIGVLLAGIGAAR
jgi:hypothetical protein